MADSEQPYSKNHPYKSTPVTQGQKSIFKCSLIKSVMLYAYFWAGNAVSYVIISPRASPLGSVWWFFGGLEDWRLQMKYYSEKTGLLNWLRQCGTKDYLRLSLIYYNHESSHYNCWLKLPEGQYLHRLYHWTPYWKMKRATYCLDLDYRFLKQKVRACLPLNKPK